MTPRPAFRFRRPRSFLVALALVAGAVARADADDVRLTGGSRLSGVLLADSEQSVHLLLPGGDEVHLVRGDIAEVTRRPDAPAAGRHLRFVPTSDGSPGGLDVAVTSWLPPAGSKGPRVDLVGAVHIADPSYYLVVQRRLDRTDVTLFEAVLPKDHGVAALESSAETDQAPNPLRALQKKLGTWLGLAFQLDAIDYTRPHFVHADLTAEELGRQLGGGEAVEESMPPALKMAMGLLKMLEPALDRLIGDEARSGPMRARLKEGFARALASPEALAQFEGAAGPLFDVLLNRRNDVALERFDEVRAAGGARSVAIFYGAAHLVGIEEGLKARGYVRGGAEWLRAWAIP